MEMQAITQSLMTVPWKNYQEVKQNQKNNPHNAIKMMDNNII